MAPSRAAIAATWSVGTNKNSALGSTNFLISHGQATRSTFTRSRVIHFIRFLLSAARRFGIPFCATGDGSDTVPIDESRLLPAGGGRPVEYRNPRAQPGAAMVGCGSGQDTEGHVRDTGDHSAVAGDDGMMSKL